jgi:CO/xanthine dehydrogenase FAD-binding subunit
VEVFTEFFAPRTVEEAVGILREKSPAARVLGGGTDMMVRIRRGMIPAPSTALVSVHRVAGMRGCRREGDAVAVGAATTASDLIRDAVVAECAPILARVADRVASAQIRNVATIGGNLANASPAGDLISPLLLLDAVLVLASPEGRRTVRVEEFFTGPGESVLRPDEIIVEARFDVPPPERVFRFTKAGTRPAMECSVVTVGLAFTPRRGALANVRVAFGSSAPTPLRGRKTEAALEGERPTPEAVERAARIAEEEVSPISDVRGSACYRRALVGVFLRRMLRD